MSAACRGKKSDEWVGDMTTYGSYNVLNDILGKVQMKDPGDSVCEAGRQVRRGSAALISILQTMGYRS